MRGFSAPIYVKPQISFSASGGMVNVSCGEKQMSLSKGKQVEDVKVIVPFPKAVSTLNLTCTVGNYMFDDISKVPAPPHHSAEAAPGARVDDWQDPQG